MVAFCWRTLTREEHPDMRSGFCIFHPDVWLQVDADEEILNEQTSVSEHVRPADRPAVSCAKLQGIPRL